MEGLRDQWKGVHAGLNRRVILGLQELAIEDTRARMKATSHLFLNSPAGNGWTAFTVLVKRTEVFNKQLKEQKKKI